MVIEYDDAVAAMADTIHHVGGYAQVVVVEFSRHGPSVPAAVGSDGR
jgi:hypothetical protein